LAEIAADFDDMPSLTERPTVAVLVRVLYFLKGMVEGIFAKALKAISGSVDNRCPKPSGSLGGRMLFARPL